MCLRTPDQRRGQVSAVNMSDFTSEVMYFDAELLDDLIMTFIGHLSYLLAAINPVENRDCTIAECHGSNNRFEPTEQVGLINEDKRMFPCFRFREALKQGPHPRFLRSIYRKRHFKETQHPFLLRLFVFHVYQKPGIDFIDAQRFSPLTLPRGSVISSANSFFHGFGLENFLATFYNVFPMNPFSGMSLFH